jgi:predicted Zn-dependent protease with MMP-like domain
VIKVSEEQFEQMIARAMDSLPKQLADAKNVGIVMQDDPTSEQLIKLKLRHDQTLFGLYEGIPLTQRSGNYSGVLPDKITLFKNPLSYSANTIAEIEERIRHTLWHELAHHYGLDHTQIHRLE